MEGIWEVLDSQIWERREGPEECSVVTGPGCQRIMEKFLMGTFTAGATIFCEPRWLLWIASYRRICLFKICSCVISDPVSVRSDFSTNIEGNPWNDRELLRSVMRGLWTVNPAWREARIEKSLDIKVNLSYLPKHLPYILPSWHVCISQRRTRGQDLRSSNGKISFGLLILD